MEQLRASRLEQEAQRCRDAAGAWFVVVLTLELGNQGNFTGENHIDIAVSQSEQSRSEHNDVEDVLDRHDR